MEKQKNAVGRRKEAVTRVFINKGNGKIYDDTGHVNQRGNEWSRRCSGIEFEFLQDDRKQFQSPSLNLQCHKHSLFPRACSVPARLQKSSEEFLHHDGYK